MSQVIKAIFIFLVLFLQGCTTTEHIVKPTSVIRIPFEHLSPKLQKTIVQGAGEEYIEDIKSGEINPTYAACGDLVYKGSAYSNSTDVVIHDAPETYYENSTGKVVAHCGYWYCFTHNDYCRKNCPPEQWSCHSS